ncbi:MAG TPA: DNA-processing protein DprA [Vicinamibacterales bacterium]|nr:DNA-processing protein DprA [Vicinamibacterales bacterium]
MTPSDAAGLAILALRDRRLVAAILRVLYGHGTVDDSESLPPQLPDESVIRWACRSRALAPTSTEWLDECTRVTRQAQEQLAQAAGRRVEAIAIGDARYPRLLSVISDPPPMLWVRGHAAILPRPGVALVGSRAATPYALAMAKRLSMDLVAAGVVVVSGLARGVDSSAHAAAVSASGQTVGVLGCGIDRIYPAEHRELARDMEVAGAIVSEFPPGVPPLPHHFPLRNRIISGLSLAVVVVEAPEKSGALITASAAAEQGRDVMVLPGPVAGGRNRGGHLLIRDGAKVVETADDILQELNLERDAREPGLGVGQMPESVEFTVDELSSRTGELPNIVLARLLELELAGKIQRIGGGRFVRVLT